MPRLLDVPQPLLPVSQPLLPLPQPLRPVHLLPVLPSLSLLSTTTLSCIAAPGLALPPCPALQRLQACRLALYALLPPRLLLLPGRLHSLQEARLRRPLLSIRVLPWTWTTTTTALMPTPTKRVCALGVGPAQAVAPSGAQQCRPAAPAPAQPARIARQLAV